MGGRDTRDSSGEDTNTNSLDDNNSNGSVDDKHHQQKQTSGQTKPPSHKRPEVNDPCPRCSSKDTKFCYYNNYNVSARGRCLGCSAYPFMLACFPPCTNHARSHTGTVPVLMA